MAHWVPESFPSQCLYICAGETADPSYLHAYGPSEHLLVPCLLCMLLWESRVCQQEHEHCVCRMSANVMEAGSFA